MVHVFKKTLVLLCCTLLVIQCSKKPNNEFEDPSHPAGQTGSEQGLDPQHRALHGSKSASVGIVKSDKKALLSDLKLYGIEYIQRGDTRTLIIPTDRYYAADTPTLNTFCYEGLQAIVDLLKMEQCSHAYIAAFTDDVGSKEHKALLSQAQAEAMLAFLWAHHIAGERLYAAGYRDQYTVANNKTIHGSAMNRRVEIQWVIDPVVPKRRFWQKMK